MRTSDILIIVWFIIVIMLDKFIQTYYTVALLIITAIFLYAIRRSNMKYKIRGVKIVKFSNHR